MSNSPLFDSMNPNRPMDRPLTMTERQVVYVLLDPSKGERPDPATEKLIKNISKETPAQWLVTVKKHPEIVQAIYSFIYGNLAERASQ